MKKDRLDVHLTGQTYITDITLFDLLTWSEGLNLRTIASIRGIFIKTNQLQ